MTTGTKDLTGLMVDVVNVRRWRSEAVAQADLDRLLTAFGLAPSTGQPWEVLRLDSEEARGAAISATLEPTMTPGAAAAQKWLFGAPVVLAVCLELRRAMTRVGPAGRDFALQEVGGAIQNFRLMANELGLRTGVVREFYATQMRAALGLPWFMEPVALIAVGYSDATPDYTRRPPLPGICRVYEPPVHGEAATETTTRASSAVLEPVVAPAVKPEDVPIPAIFHRRSVRRYTGEPLPPGVREQLLTAAVLAPSAGNMQAWEFILIEDPAVRQAVVGTTHSGFYSGPGNEQTWILDASLIMAVCVNVHRHRGRYGPGVARGGLLEAAAAIQNILITAAELGLGSCWIAGYGEQELAAVLGIPPGVEVVSLVTIGPAVEMPAPRHRLPLDLVTHRDRWGVPYYTVTTEPCTDL